MTEKRRPRLLWANLYCLLDHSSGAALAVRQMLLQLQAAGWDISILGATNFDSENGSELLAEHLPELRRRQEKTADVEDGPLLHRLFVTARTRRHAMTNREEGAWYSLYIQALERDRPDVVFYYGGQPFDFMIADEARRRGIRTAFYLANGNYQNDRWCRDVDLILTDSQATADLYKDRLKLDVRPVGTFIDPSNVLASDYSLERLLFINPLPSKGAAWVARLALWFEKRRPDIMFEVVESRGRWSDILLGVTGALGSPRTSLDNVVVTPSSRDMRPVYGRARLLLAPSLGWESGGRVLAEAMLNGIPAITTDRGGQPEMVQDGGIVVKLPEKYYEPPYLLAPAEEEVGQLATMIESLYDDRARYDALARAAYAVGQRVHGLEANIARLVDALAPLTRRPAGKSRRTK